MKLRVFTQPGSFATDDRGGRPYSRPHGPRNRTYIHCAHDDRASSAACARDALPSQQKGPGRLESHQRPRLRDVISDRAVATATLMMHCFQTCHDQTAMLALMKLRDALARSA
jgi:hypothetical protein